MFIGYQDVDLKVYDDQSDDFYYYLEDSVPPEEDEFLRRFVKRKLKNKKKLIKNSLFGFGGMGMGAKVGFEAAKGLKKSIKSRRKKRRARRASRRTSRATAKRRIQELKRRVRRKSSYPTMRPIQKKTPKNWGRPHKAPVPVLNIPMVRKSTSINPVKSYTNRKSAPIRTPKREMPTSSVIDSNNLSTTSSQPFENLEGRSGTEKPKQAGMGKNIIWVVAIVGGLIIVTKVFTGKKTSEIVKVKQAA